MLVCSARKEDQVSKTSGFLSWAKEFSVVGEIPVSYMAFHLCTLAYVSYPVSLPHFLPELRDVFSCDTAGCDACAFRKGHASYF